MALLRHTCGRRMILLPHIFCCCLFVYECLLCALLSKDSVHLKLSSTNLYVQDLRNSTEVETFTECRNPNSPTEAEPGPSGGTTASITGTNGCHPGGEDDSRFQGSLTSVTNPT